LEALIVNIGLVVAAAFGWAGTAATFITANPLVLLMFIVPVAGIGITFIKRLMN